MTTIRNMPSSATAKYAAIRVLLVDDHSSIRSIIAGILNALGVTDIVTAPNGDIATEYLTTGNFDLLITDNEMPGITGLQLAKNVRGEARKVASTINFDIPILMVTGTVTRARLNEARDAGIDEILAKPFTVLGVADRLNKIVNSRREFIISETYVGPCRRRSSKADYVGPKRRDSDLANLPTFEVEQEQLLLRQEALSLCKFAQSETGLAFGEQDAVIALALSAAQRANRIREPFLARACMSLAKYVRGVGTNLPVETKIVDTHGQAILELLDIGKRDERISQQVVQGLEGLVTQRASKRARRA